MTAKAIACLFPGPKMDKLNKILDTLEQEIAKTLHWRKNKGMRPASDTSEFAGANISTLLKLQWWIKELRVAAAQAEKE